MERIEIKGYKSIKHVDLALRQINILIGANGSGKSNFLSFFEFLRNLYAQNLRNYIALRGGADKMLFNGIKVTSEVSAKLYFDKNQYSFTLQMADEGLIFTDEGLWYDGNPYVGNPQNIASLTYESNLKTASSPRASYIRNYLEGLVKYHFHDTGNRSPFTQLSDIDNDKFRLYPQGENLAAFLYDIRQNHPISYNLIVKTVQSIAPYFGDFFLQPEGNKVVLRWTSKYSETIYGVKDLSDGTIRFIALCTLFLQPQLPKTIIIDEPELGLHPTAINKLSGLIKSAAAKGCQVVAATQSTDLIANFDPEDIIAVDSGGEGSHFNRLDFEHLKTWLEDYYTIDELWKRNIIAQGQPNYF